MGRERKKGYEAAKVRTLALIVPVFNEEKHLPQLIRDMELLSKGIINEIVFVNDGSDDQSIEILRKFVDKAALSSRLINLERNLGKGNAIVVGLKHVKSTHAAIWDADLEIPISELNHVSEILANRNIEVILGFRRFLSHSSFSYRFVFGNRLISHVYGFLFDVYIQDVMCGLKVLPLWLWEELNLKQKGFAVEVEILANILYQGIRPFEIEIQYNPRSRSQGKGITVWDGVKILSYLFVLRLKYPPKAWERGRG
jgi:glycosyltransferase involved in cell wall biosynthesis